MKKVLTLTAILFTLSATAQKEEGVHFIRVGQMLIPNTITLKNDTLYVPAGSVKFIKVGDKVYKLVTTLEEVKEDAQPFIFKGGWQPYNSSNLLLTK